MCPSPGIRQCIQCSVRTSPVTSVSLTQHPSRPVPPLLSWAWHLGFLWNLQCEVWFSHNPTINLSATWRFKRGGWPTINNWWFWVSLQEKEKPKGNSLYCLPSTSVEEGDNPSSTPQSPSIHPFPACSVIVQITLTQHFICARADIWALHSLTLLILRKTAWGIVIAFISSLQMGKQKQRKV